MLTQEENDRLTRVGPGTPGGEFMRRVDTAYRSLAEREPDRIVAVDGDRPVGQIAEEIREHVLALL